MLQVRSKAKDGQTLESVVPLDPFVDRRAWRVTASSFQRGEGDPQHVLDGDPNTIWHTRYSPDKATGPHTLTVDMAAPISVKAVLLTPRPDGSNGRIAGYELYLSDDPNNFGTPLLKGTVPDEGALQTLSLPTPKTGRYLKIVVRSEHSGQGLASLAEISIVPGD